MSELIHDKVFSEILMEIVGTPGDNPLFAETLVNKYLHDISAQTLLLVKSGSTVEDLQDYLKGIREKVIDTVIQGLIKSSEFKDSLYEKSYERLKALGDEGKSYGDLFTEIYEDEVYLNEIFVRIVEEAEGVAITSSLQLQELTGITEIYSYWDEGKQEVLYHGGKKPTKKEAQDIAKKEIEHAFTSAMSYRYSKALMEILDRGGKYSDLLQVKPSYFNLPDKDQYSSILWAIEHTFLIGEPSSSVRPDLKTIAQDIEAPYSVLMDAHKICNGWKVMS